MVDLHTVRECACACRPVRAFGVCPRSCAPPSCVFDSSEQRVAARGEGSILVRAQGTGAVSVPHGGVPLVRRRRGPRSSALVLGPRRINVKFLRVATVKQYHAPCLMSAPCGAWCPRVHGTWGVYGRPRARILPANRNLVVLVVR